MGGGGGFCCAKAKGLALRPTAKTARAKNWVFMDFLGLSNKLGV
jgi:hypothetical protein